ncbi:calcium-binding protein [Streptomyces sp. KR80]|uniref:calcium-binding protein n=1 Tax=Streptomyces sp. KR80 TaxID=3457426 RepID=UPI003FD6BB62
MRIRATVAAGSGVLVLAALAVPVAHAEYQPVEGPHKPDASERFGSAAAAKSVLGNTSAVADEPVVSNITVHAGKDVVVGTTNLKTFTVLLTASHASGIQDAYLDLWHGSDVDNIDGYLGPDQEAATCTASSATTSTCKLTITADPQGAPEENGLYANALAGTWHVTAAALAGDGSFYWNDSYKSHKVKRYAKLTTNASPEPVAKGKTLIVTGKLSRANWETHTYKGYTNQSVTLQFRKAGTRTYSNVKTVTTNSYGGLKTSLTATYDGYWRYTFAGTSTTGAATSTSDYVDVQ